jgi:hypothetical protein
VNATNTRATFLLVHGGHHGPWCWEKLRTVLNAEGWSTHAVSLPSAVRDEHFTEPLPGMFDDARVIREALDQPACFYDGDATNPETVEAISRLVPQTVRADFETVTRAGWHTVPNSYVIPDQDVSVVATVEERMAARADTVYHCEGHHAPFYSHPKEFAALLTQIAEAA